MKISFLEIAQHELDEAILLARQDLIMASTRYND